MNDNSPMLARLSAFVVWAFVAGAIVFWGLRLFVTPTSAPAHAVAVVDGVGGGGDLSRLFGAEAAPEVEAPPPESTRFKLVGVLAERQADGRFGVALISIDGKPARPYRVGASVEDNLKLKAVSANSASFGSTQGTTAFTLEVPRLPEPATSTLNPVDSSQLQVIPPPAVQAPEVPQPPQPTPPQTVPPPPEAAPVEGPTSTPAASGPPPNSRMFRGGPGSYQR